LSQLEAKDWAIAPATLYFLVLNVGINSSKNALDIASKITAKIQRLVTVVNVVESSQVEYILYDQECLRLLEDITDNRSKKFLNTSESKFFDS
jgi:hypothetical protein